MTKINVAFDAARWPRLARCSHEAAVGVSEDLEGGGVNYQQIFTIFLNDDVEEENGVGFLLDVVEDTLGSDQEARVVGDVRKMAGMKRLGIDVGTVCWLRMPKISVLSSGQRVVTCELTLKLLTETMA